MFCTINTAEDGLLLQGGLNHDGHCRNTTWFRIPFFVVIFVDVVV